jgi:YHS domain-containing protein
MKKVKLVIFAVILALISAGALQAAEAKPQTTCPVLGGNVTKQVYVDYKGKRIYFCCAGCEGEFNKDPEKYIKKLEEQGVTLEKAPEAGAKK